MVFRLIGVILELLWAIAKREAEIDSLKERATKAEKELKVHSEKNRELHVRLRVLEIERESDKNHLSSLERSLATRREYDLERIARLEMRTEPDKNPLLPGSDDHPQKTLSELMQEMNAELDRRGHSPAPTNSADN